MSRLKEMYNSEIIDAMMKKFEYKNIMQVPKIAKIVVNMGVGEAKDNAKALEAAELRIAAGGVKTFKVETKRGDKSFPLNSPQISEEAGGRILDAHPELRVDVRNPDMTVYIEVREQSYAYTEIIKAPGGMPIGSNGKACLLLSGGIDSPVAGYMIGKRGVAVWAVHFYSYPYTSERAKEKVLELARLVSRFTGPMKVMVVPFTDIQLAIMQKIGRAHV